MAGNQIDWRACRGCGRAVRVTAKSCAFCRTSTEGLADEPAVAYIPPPSPDANPSQARMIATPVIVVVAGYVLGLLVGPLLLWLAGSLVLAGAWLAVTLSRHQAAPPTPAAGQVPPPTEAADMVPCPRCAEPIRAAAVACRYCGHEIAR